MQYLAVAYVTADAMLYMLLHSVSVPYACAAAFVCLAAPCAVLSPLHMLLFSPVQLPLAVDACDVAFVYVVNIVCAAVLCSCC